MSAAKKTALDGGVICALVTPLGSDEKPDAAALARLIDHQISSGIHGLFVAGTSGEGPLLTREERRLLAEQVVEAVAGRIPVIVHCGAADTRTSEHLARHAQAIGADAVAAVGPYFYSFGPTALFDHFRNIAEAAPEIPNYLYENPERVGYSLGVDMVGRLTREVPNIVGIKDTGDSLGRLMVYLSLFDPLPQIFTGNNSLLYPAVRIGADGAVSALANVVPKLFVAIYDAAIAGRDDEALELQKVAARFQSCFAGLPYVPGIKYLIGRYGLELGLSRRPHSPLSNQMAGELDERVDGCKGLAEWFEKIDA
jgi:dihydrodipicolinate synthase/N-acetylneuraminate lyase